MSLKNQAKGSTALSALFIPITKVDAENRIVYGQMTAEGCDSSNEIWDYEGSKPYFEAWTAGAEKSSGGKSLGNLRSMHQPIAAGKLTQFVMDDATKTVEIAAKVVDDVEWKKVEEGVYTGFSQGGRYVKRWKDPDDATKTRYISDPVEVSLVDLPCLPTATFEYIKGAGLSEMRKFNTTQAKEDTVDPTNEEVAARATEMAKAAGDATKWVDMLDDARADLIAKASAPAAVEETAGEPAPAAEPEAPAPVEAAAEEPAAEPEADANKVADPAADGAAPEANDGESDKQPGKDKKDKTKKARESLVQMWHTPDGKSFAKAADAVAHIVGPEDPPASPVDAALAAANKAASGETAEAEGAEDEVLVVATEGLTTAKAVLDGLVQKGLYTASRAIEVLGSVICLQSSTAWEADYQNSNSGVAGQLAEVARDLGAAALTLAQEEIAQALAGMKGDDPILVETFGNSAEAEFVKGIFADTDLCEKVAKRGVVEEPVAEEAPAETDLAKRAESDPVIKALLTENTELKGEVTKAVEGITGLTKTVTDMRAEMDTLRQTPAPMAPRTQVVGKTVDGQLESPGGPVDVGKAQAMINELSKTQDGQRMLAEAAIRASQAHGVQL